MIDEKTQLKELQKQIAKLTEGIAKLSGDRVDLTFGDFASVYLQQKLMRPTLRKATLQSFRQSVENYLIPGFGPVPIADITSSMWLYWVSEIRSRPKGSAITRFFNVRKYLIEILLAAKEEGHIDRVPKIEIVDEPKSTGRTLSDKEIFSILRHTKNDQDRFFFYCLYKMGCRPREILQWEWSMFIWNEPGKTWLQIPARISKTDRQRDIPVNPQVSKRLWKQYSRLNIDSIFVFPHPINPNRYQASYHSAWNSACKHAKVKAVPYDMRRTFITRCAACGMPLLYVAKALDTSTKMIESVYAKAQVEVMEGIMK